MPDKFDPTKFDEYVAILTTHAKTLASILHQLSPDEGKGEATTGKGQGSRRIDDIKDLPAQAERVLRALGQRPWLLKPVATDTKGRYQFIEDRENLEEGWTLVYEGVTKKEHLDTVVEAYQKERENETVDS